MTEVLPLKTRLSIFFLTSISNLARRPNGTINRWLLGALDPIAKARPQNSDGIRVSDETVDSTRNVWFRLFVPTGVSDQLQLPVIVFMHGGGFSFFAPDYKEYDVLCRKFALKNLAIVVSVNYRLAPENRYPAPYDDVFDTLKFLDQMAFDSFPANANLSRCFLAGDSCGGNIAHHVARRFAEAASEFSKLKVIGLIAMQPWFGGEERTESEIRLKSVPFVSIEAADWHWKAFLPEGANRDHEAANVFGPKASDMSGLSNFPDTLLFVGGLDPLQDWQKRYFESLKGSGIRAELSVSRFAREFAFSHRSCRVHFQKIICFTLRPLYLTSQCKDASGKRCRSACSFS